jgi:hypothetical protein
MLSISIFCTTIFLTHLYPILAFPLVSKDDVAAGQSLDLTNALVKRQRYFPADQKCDDPQDWYGRNCLTILDQAWLDSCITEEDVDYWRLGSCPDDTMCMDSFTPPPEEAPTIMCVIRPTCDGCKPDIRGGPPSEGGQVGVYHVADRRRSVSVEIVDTISQATVTAFMEGTYQISQLTLTWRFLLLIVANYEGTDGNYIVKPNSPLVGTLRQSTKGTCSYNDTNRDCVPSGRYDLTAGNIIDFTFDIGVSQVVWFYYGIFGS